MSKKPGSVNCSALCIGCNYTGTQSELEGCENDLDDFLGVLPTILPGGACLSVREIRGGDVILSTVQEAIDKLATSGSLDIPRILYFAGHGYRGKCLSTQTLAEALVMNDGSKLWDFDLSDRLSRAIGPVVIILDCCHSGGASRIPTEHNCARVRVWREGRDSVVPEQSVAPSGMLLPSLPRGRYTLVAACLPHQQAREVFYEQEGRYRGIFTVELLRALRQCTETESLNFVTWRHIMHRISSQVSSHTKGTQQPFCEGLRDCAPFRVFVGNAWRHVVPAVPFQTNQTWILDAGSSVGVGKGSVWEMVHPDIGVRTGLLVTETFQTRSTLSLEPGSQHAFQSVDLGTGPSLVRCVQCFFGERTPILHVQGSLLEEQYRNLFGHRPFMRLYEGALADSPSQVFSLRIEPVGNSFDRLVVFGNGSEQECVRGLVCGLSSSEPKIIRFLDLIEKHALYRSLLTMGSSPPLRTDPEWEDLGKLSLTILSQRKERVFEAGGFQEQNFEAFESIPRLEMLDGDRYQITVRHRGPPLHVAILEFAEDGAIQQLFPNPGAQDTLVGIDRREASSCRMESYISRSVGLRCSSLEFHQTIRIFLSSAQMDLSWLETGIDSHLDSYRPSFLSTKRGKVLYEMSPLGEARDYIHDRVCSIDVPCAIGPAYFSDHHVFRYFSGCRDGTESNSSSRPQPDAVSRLRARMADRYGDSIQDSRWTHWYKEQQDVVPLCRVDLVHDSGTCNDSGLDVVFVHGFFGNSLGTWAADTESREYWPKQWLPSILSSAAFNKRLRIFNLNHGGILRKFDLEKIVGNARREFARLRIGEEDQSVVLAGHGIGCHLVREIWSQDLKIRERTRGMVFFGPGCYSEGVRNLEQALSILGRHEKLDVQSQEVLSKDCKIQAIVPALDIERSSSIFPQILNFVEDDMYSDTATGIDLSGEIISLDSENHFTICKPVTSGDPVVVRTALFLKGLL